MLMNPSTISQEPRLQSHPCRLSRSMAAGNQVRVCVPLQGATSSMHAEDASPFGGLHAFVQQLMRESEQLEDHLT